MLESLLLEGFKPFGQAQQVPLGPLTLVYGPNSAGKSSLIQALLLLKQSLASAELGGALRPSGALVDLGTYRSLLHRHEASRTLRLGVGFRMSESGARPGVERGDYAFEWQFQTEYAAGEAVWLPQLRSVRYRFSDAQGALDCGLTRIREAATGAYVPVGEHVYKWLDPASLRSFSDWLRQRSRSEGSEPDPELGGKGWQQVLRAIEFQDAPLLPTRPVVRADAEAQLAARAGRVLQHHGGSLGMLSAALQRAFERLDYLGPLRSYPQRYTPLSGGDPRSVGRVGEHTASRILRHPEAVEDINRWFSRFELPYAIEAERIGTEVTGDIVVLNLLDQRTGVRVAPTDVGFGLGQILPVLVEGGGGSGRTICVEQPEIHLHPRMQAHLADFFIETARLPRAEARRGSARRERGHQWILETHSEALMLRLQRRVREGRLHPDDLCVLYVQPDGAHGSRVMRLSLDARGEFLDEWPDGFFEDSFLELFGEAAL
ncbi:MAG: AAA family ATPase [Candidatus Sericytochromatia bacterium]|nr:AAA family ATPase [Candidatus Sericytochromatia bacterium]